MDVKFVRTNTTLKTQHRRHFHQKQDVSLIEVVAKLSKYFHKSVLNILDIELSCKLDACRLTKLAVACFFCTNWSLLARCTLLLYATKIAKKYGKNTFLPAVATIDNYSSFSKISS